MKDIKKLMITLVALLAVTTGAWAQEQWDVVWDFTAWSTETVTALKADAAASKLEGWSDVEKKADAEAGADPTEAAKDNCFWFAGTVNEDGSLSANGAVIKELKGLKFNSDYAAKRSLAIAVNYPSTSLGDYAGGAYLWLGGGGSKQTCPCFTIPGVKAGSKITIEVESNKPSDGRGIGLYKNSYAAENLIGEQFKPTAKEAKTWDITEDCDVVVYNTNSCHIYTIKVKAPASAASGPEVAWDKTKKTGTFTMPGGNVTLEPEYYPQAALTAAPTAINDVPATTDGAIVKAGTVANIGSTTTAQGTVMYYVSKTEMTDAALLALAADKWTADVPTAETFTAAGQAYVYYYVRGNDSDTDDENFSDGDILSANALTVTIAAEPTYAVTFAEGTDPNEWTASPAAGVTKGTPVTVTYSGSKKVIGVKAEKKAGDTGKSLAEATVGMIIGSNGKAYAADDKDNLPEGVTAVAKVCYVDGTGHGLALALTDEVEEMNWSTAQTTCAAHTPAITGGTWKLASKDEWNNMITAAGSHTALRDGFSSVGGTNMQSDFYWSSTTISYGAWYYTFDGGSWSNGGKGATQYVRACLAF